MNDPVKILFAVENREEFNELVILVQELLSAGQDKREAVLFKTHAIYQLPDYSRDYDSIFAKIYSAKNPFERNFKHLSVFKKVIIILINTLMLIRIFRNHKITHILSGVPLIFHRMAILLFPSVLHLAYLRGVLLFSRKATSVSDRFFFLSDKFRALTSIRFFNNYFADYLFTIGSLNKIMLQERNIPEANILLSGPLLLDRYRQMGGSAGTARPRQELIYITQAYLWHLDTTGHNEQMHSLRALLECAAGDYNGQFDICIRVHPRDDQSIYEGLLKDYALPVRIDTSPAAEFLQDISGHKILISGLSTLAFEWIYLGGSCVFLSTEKLMESSRKVYDRLGISPYLDAGRIFEDILAGHIPDCRKQIDRIFYRHSCGNLQYVLETINTIFNRDER